MKKHLSWVASFGVAALLISSVFTAAAAEKKSKPKTPPPTPPSPTEQLESARVITRKQPALAIEATIKRENFELQLHASRAGDDWEIHVDGEKPFRLIRKDGQYWLSRDKGESWRQTQTDDEFSTLLMAPLDSSAGTNRPTYESLGKEVVDGVDLQHLRLVPDKGDKLDPDDLPQQWLVSDGHIGWLVRRSRVPATLFNQTVNVDVTYEVLPKETVIEAPVNKAASAP